MDVFRVSMVTKVDAHLLIDLILKFTEHGLVKFRNDCVPGRRDIFFAADMLKCKRFGEENKRKGFG